MQLTLVTFCFIGGIVSEIMQTQSPCQAAYCPAPTWKGSMGKRWALQTAAQKHMLDLQQASFWLALGDNRESAGTHSPHLQGHPARQWDALGQRRWLGEEQGGKEGGATDHVCRLKQSCSWTLPICLREFASYSPPATAWCLLTESSLAGKLLSPSSYQKR